MIIFVAALGLVSDSHPTQPPSMISSPPLCDCCIMEILKYFIKPNQIIRRIQLFVEALYLSDYRDQAGTE